LVFRPEQELPRWSARPGNGVHHLLQIRGKTEFYTDFGRSNSVDYTLGLNVLSDENHVSFLSLNRGSDAGEYKDEECRLLSELRPHLRQAIRISEKIAQLEASRKVLDHVQSGVFLLEDNLRVLEMNARARATVDLRDGLSLHRGTLMASRRQDQVALRECVRSGIGAARVVRPSGRPDYLALPAPKMSGIADQALGRRQNVLFVAEADSAIDVMGALRKLFGLTPAEAKLAQALTHSRSLVEAADQLTISHETARTQLAAVFRKTSTRSQLELVRLVSRLGMTQPGQ
jgi:DNA-binding CsgD family transcriptional regulator